MLINTAYHSYDTIKKYFYSCEASVKVSMNIYDVNICSNRAIVQVYGKGMNTEIQIYDFKTNQRYRAFVHSLSVKSNPLRKNLHENQKIKSKNQIKILIQMKTLPSIPPLLNFLKQQV